VFDDFRLDRLERQLWRKEEPVGLAPKSIELLLVMAEARGRLLSRETLMETVWPSTFVDENNLTQHIVRIRKALGDDAYIETVPRRGYRFHADIVEMDDLPSSDVAPVPARAGRSWWKLAAGSAALAAACAAAIHFGQPSAPRTSVTVVPFRMMPPTDGGTGIAAGVTEAVSNRLGSRRGLSVHPPAGAALEDPRAMAARTEVDAVVSGAVRVRGETLTVTAQLFDARRGENVWSRRFETTRAGIAEIEDAIADEIGNLLQPGLTDEQRAELTPPHSRDAIANADYLLGRDLLDRRVRIQESVVYFERAVARDPGFALGWAALAEALAYPRHPVANEISRATDAVKRALRLDPSVAEAHATRGFIHLFYDWDPPAAARELRTALQLNPSSARVHDWYSLALLTNGDAAGAIASIDRARSLDPASTDIAEDAAFVRIMVRDFAGAERTARAAILLDPGSQKARGFLADSLRYQGRFREAVTEVASFRDRRNIALERALMEFENGDRRQAEWIRSHLTRRPDYAAEGIATAYAVIGDEATALQYLERALEQRSFGLIFTVLNPAFDPLRGSPRFERIVREVGVKLPFR
jgi:adenylate cyclase